MEIRITPKDATVVVHCSGRLDTVGSRTLHEGVLGSGLAPEFKNIVLDLDQTDYLSSAGLRVVLMLQKEAVARGGVLVFCGLQSYVSQVIAMTGFGDRFPTFVTVEEAIAFCGGNGEGTKEAADPFFEGTNGRLRVISSQSAEPVVRVMGSIEDVLYARVAPQDVVSKKFFETEYSIGFGGLGDKLNDYYHVMGEMITVGGTMVWLPTDGQDTPDYLIPKVDLGDVMIRTGFNVSVAGGFNELVLFESASPEGCTVGELYSQMFDFARTRFEQNGYHGVLGLAMVADMATVLGSGVRKSAVIDFQPSNRLMITAPENYDAWMESDQAPRHRGVTALIVGVGACLGDDLDHFDQEQLNEVFYLHPANIGSRTQMLHNHAVVFQPLPLPDPAAGLEAAIESVVDAGEFIDMRHLLDNSRVSRALVGIGYVQRVEADDRAVSAD